MTDTQKHYLERLRKVEDVLKLIKKETYFVTADKKYTEDKALYESLARIQNMVDESNCDIGYVRCKLWVDWNDNN